jgi:glutamate decarboxylase
VPAYRLPPNAQETVVLRVVVRNGFSHDLADLLLADIDAGIAHLSLPPRKRRTEHRSSFSHT